MNVYYESVEKKIWYRFT